MCPPDRALLTSLPEEVLEKIINHLHGKHKVGSSPITLQYGSCHIQRWALQSCTGVQGHLPLCCKATLPILCMGHVWVKTDEHKREGPIVQATRCLTKQPGAVSHLHLWSKTNTCCIDTRQLIDFRCAHAMVCLSTRAVACMREPLLLPCHSHVSIQDGTDDDAALRFCSLLSKLRELSLSRVAVPMPTLQPVATRLRELSLTSSCLQGSADGFLTRGWTALTTLCLAWAHAETATMTAALELPALKELIITGFRHQGGVLHLDQLTGSCPNIRRLRFQLDSDLARGREGSGPCCSLLKLGRLTDLYICAEEEPSHANLDLDLPVSLTDLEVDGAGTGDHLVDVFWPLSEAAKCIRRGGNLRKVTCGFAEARVQPAQWGASLDEQYWRLGGQLSSLAELSVWGCNGQEPLLCALSAVMSSAPSLTFVTLDISILKWQPHIELPPICSASLTSTTVDLRSLLMRSQPCRHWC